MFYEGVMVKSGETVSGLAAAYGYRAAEWRRIWDNTRNSALVARRGTPERLQVGDVVHIPVPWTMTSKSHVVTTVGSGLIVKRSGEKGERLRWVQTVYQHNQLASGTSAFCVDGCPADDVDPFYWTASELKGDPTLRNTFKDFPQRSPPSKSAGTTKWRAVLSIAVATDKRVTVFDSIVWGFDVTSAGVYSKVGPRAATLNEVSGHVNLLKKGLGTGGDFKAGGWTFRTP
jgi:hypothetical protein